ncbi:hypothetical protein [uncultured Gemella sp.]|uniref:hypothetical protein n=1 Tax=uncultured Gemella sp. TaxID=254352 RepID=UPI0028CFE081|nr:hypothetical protein [uncultured Gemella sp.]
MEIALQDFFCEKASNRIGKLIKKKNLNSFKVYEDNATLITWIVRGERTKRNPYLLTETSTNKILESLYGQGLSESERKRVSRMLYWGDNEEISEYIYDLMKCICKNLTEEQQEILDDTLIDDIYFAETKAYKEIVNEINAPLIGINIEELESEDIPVSRYLAEKELLENIKDEFLEKFIKFLDSANIVRTKENGKNVYIDKGITFKNQFDTDNIVEIFLDIVKNHKIPTEESIGFRVYSIVKKDISKLDSLIERELVYDTVYSAYSKDEILEADLNFQRKIIEAGEMYIDFLKYTYRKRNQILDKLNKEGEI